MRVIDCPVCVLTMQPFFVESGDGATKVELDRCPKCARLWFDVKELERASGRNFLPRMKGTDSSHPCPVCKVTLGTSLIRGDVAIEECGTCGGALLDAHDFELIAGKPLKAARPPPPPKVVEFTCERCRNRTPVSEARTVKGATVCKSCESKPWPNQPGYYKGEDIGDAISKLFDNLFG